MRPVIVVHNLEHARAALSAAVACGRAVTLLSPPGAAQTIGATVFREMIKAAAEAVPEARYGAVLDCADEPGMAMGAMRHGIKMVRIEGGQAIRAQLADIAAQRGAELLTDTGEALDLIGMLDPEAACRAWIDGADAGADGDGS